MFIKESTHKPTQWRAKWIWLDKKHFPNLQESESYSCMREAPSASCIAIFEKRFTLQKCLRNQGIYQCRLSIPLKHQR